MVISSPSVEESAFHLHCFGRDRIEFILSACRFAYKESSAESVSEYFITISIPVLAIVPSVELSAYPPYHIIIGSSNNLVLCQTVFSSSLNRSYFRESKQLCRLLASNRSRYPNFGSRLPYHSLSAYIVAAALGSIHISTVLAPSLRSIRQSPLQPR